MTDLEARSQYIFHYTSKFDYLLSILRDGFWPRYCAEDYSPIFWDHIGQSFWLAFPMVCFTDLPPAVAGEHREKYGHYAIQLSKDFIPKADLQHVIYVHRDSRLGRHFKATLRPDGGRIQLDSVSQNPLLPLLPFVKVTPWAQKSRDPGRNPDPDGKVWWELIAFEEEMEWRYVPELPNLPGLAGSSDDFVPPAQQAATAAHRLQFDPVYVESVVVLTPEEKQKIEAEFPHLSGKARIR